MGRFDRVGRQDQRLCQDRNVTLVIAHRGASHVERENTLAAFRRAAEMGAEAVELDVRRGGDDRLVVHHNPHLADGRLVRTTPSHELPDDVPELRDALAACERMFVNIEIKNDPDEPDFDPSDWVAHRVCALLAEIGGGLRWLISSFRLETVNTCRALLPGVRTAWLVERLDAEVIAATAGAGHVAVHPKHDVVDAANMAAAHAAGLVVNVWTCDEPERMRALIGWGVDGICTNVPDVALAVRRGG